MKAFNHWLVQIACVVAGVQMLLFAASSHVHAASWVATSDGVVGLWHADGNGNDAVGGNNATLFGGVTFAEGVIGLGFKCNGRDDKIVVPDTPVLNFAAKQDFSIEAWVKPAASPGNYKDIMTVVSKRVAPDTITQLGYELYLQEGRLCFQLADKLERYSWHNFESTGPDLRDGKFHHVAVTVNRRSASGGILYVDGQPVLTFDPTVCPGDLSNPGPLRIGSHPVNGLPCFFNGMIDEVSIYNRVLSASEIQAASSSHAESKAVLSLSSQASQPGSTQVQSMIRQAGGNMLIEFSGSGAAYRVEASTNLVNWETIGAATRQADGTFNFTDSDSGKFSTRFYRIVSQ
jgi:hypothetical protein